MGVIWFNPKGREVEVNTVKLVEKYLHYRTDLVVCVGGDGTILGAEIKYPGVAKLALKSSKTCKRCCQGDLETVLSLIKTGKVRPKEYLKLEVEAEGRRLLALNEVNIRSLDPRSALRFEFQGEEIIGDGLVAATPFGATGYFENVTGAVFETGIGVAFNNANRRIKALVIPEDREIKLRITRGPAGIYVDNNPDWIKVENGEMITVKRSQQKALVFGGLGGN